MGLTVSKAVHMADNKETKYNMLKIKLGKEYIIDFLTETEYLSQIF